MQNSSYKWRLSFNSLILIIILLPAYTSTLAAESYIRVLDKEVVYYYFSNRKPPQLKQNGINPLILQRGPSNPRPQVLLPKGPTFIQKMDELHILRPLAIRAVLRMESDFRPDAALPASDLNFEQLRFKKAEEVPVVNLINFDSSENIWLGSRYLGRFLAKFRNSSVLNSAAQGSDSQQTDCYQSPPPVQDMRALVRYACSNYLKYAQELPPELAQLKPGADPLAGLGKFNYCFPVAPPFSFRDSWGDPRSGGRYHFGVDIAACEGTPVYAITTGVIKSLSVGPESGIALFLQGQDGRSYGYMHLQGYAEGIVEGKAVNRGEVIAYVGLTGIINSAAHLHLQVYSDHNFNREALVNPYGMLIQLCNGKGITDFSDRKIARRMPEANTLQYRSQWHQMPEDNTLQYRSLRLSRMVPNRLPPAPHFLEHYLKPVTKKQ